jgi:hypothetical protein
VAQPECSIGWSANPFLIPKFTGVSQDISLLEVLGTKDRVATLSAFLKRQLQEEWCLPMPNDNPGESRFGGRRYIIIMRDQANVMPIGDEGGTDTANPKPTIKHSEPLHYNW